MRDFGSIGLLAILATTIIVEVKQAGTIDLPS